MLRRTIAHYAFLGLLVAPVLGVVEGCKEEVPAKVATVKAGEMPSGGEWSGVYYSQLYGYLHMLAEGTVANGAWRTTAGDKWGEMHGTIEGDLLKYSWTEHTIGMVGANADRKGKGYFRYSIPKDSEAPVIAGEWGLGDDEVGYKWEAVKQVNMEPKPETVKPDEVEGHVSGGGWDDGEGGDESEEGESGDKEEKSDDDSEL